MITLEWSPATEAVIIWHLEEGWDWNDFIRAINRCWDMINERQPSVPTCMVLLMPRSMAFPSGSFFSSIGYGMRQIARVGGIVVVVAQTRFHSTVISIVRKVLPEGVRLYAVASVDEALSQVSVFREPPESSNK